MKKNIYILKIGGSVATHKNRQGASVRRDLLKKIAKVIKQAQEKNDFQLILIHGAGSLGHQLASDYGLKEGTSKDPKKIHGALISRIANQKLDAAICDIFVSEGLQVTPVHTASVIIQKDKKINSFDLKNIVEALDHGYIPMLYGDMVFDEKLGMSICSGDAIAPYLALKLPIKKIFFASDIKGVFTEDPYINKEANLIEEIYLNKIEKKVSLSESHNIDTTSGLLGKIKSLKKLERSSIECVEIFNGLKAENYNLVLSGSFFPHTKIFVKK